MSWREESDALHARVRALARGESAEAFDSLALDIARFQERRSPGFRRLCAAHGGFSSVDQIPAVPSAAFRLSRVAVHPPELDAARFFTSGTTASDPGSAPGRTGAVSPRRARARSVRRRARGWSWWPWPPIRATRANLRSAS